MSIPLAVPWGWWAGVSIWYDDPLGSDQEPVPLSTTLGHLPVHFFVFHLFTEGPVGSLMSSKRMAPQVHSGQLAGRCSLPLLWTEWQRSLENTVRSWTPSHAAALRPVSSFDDFFPSAGQRNALTDGDPGSPVQDEADIRTAGTALPSFWVCCHYFIIVLISWLTTLWCQLINDNDIDSTGRE